MPGTLNFTESEPEKIDSTPPDPREVCSFWLPLLILVSLTLVTQLASVSLVSDKDFADVFLPGTIALLLVTTPLAALGLSSGPGIGLGAPLLTALLMRSPGALRQVAKVKALAAAIGLSVGSFLWWLRLAILDALPPDLPDPGHR